MSDPLPGLPFDAAPFDLLDADQRARLERATDLGYYPAGTGLIVAGEPSPCVYVIMKGLVHASDPHGRGEDARFADYGPGDLFGAFAVIAGRARHSYSAIEDTLCALIPAAEFQHLLEANTQFGAWFHQALSVKRRLLAEQQQPGELNRLMLTRVQDAQLAPVRSVDAATSIGAAAAELRSHRVDCLLVQDAEAGPGIVTRTDLLDALTAGGRPVESTIADLASRPLLAVRDDEVLFQALVSMTEHHVERVVVMRDNRAIGTLGLAEVLAHYASSSHLISLRLARATTIEEIADAARGMTDLVRQLHAQGAKISYLTEIVSALNRRVMARVFDAVVPQSHRDGLCLLVLGSEGRREQILKTDQDNALILADGYDWSGLSEAMSEFSRALQAIGYPPCPGGVMVSNPHWRLQQREWRERIALWARSAEGRTPLDLAIVLDARPVAGDESLYTSLLPALQDLRRDRILLRYLAEAAVRDRNPLTLFGQVRREDGAVDVKRAGIFPLVHGLRTLALEHGIAHRNSFDRAAALLEAGVIGRELGRDAPQALSVLMRLRLGQQLADLAAGRSASNRIAVAELRHLDRELLRDSLRVVNEFKAQVRDVFGVDG